MREEVLTMALFSRTECNKIKRQEPMPMDLSAVMNKIREEFGINQQEQDYGEGHCQHTEVPEINVDFGGSDGKMSEVNKMAQELMALVKGKGKGKETRMCYNC